MRIFCFLGTVLIALFLPFWAFVLAALVYALVWNAYELLVLALFIDAEFGDRSQSIWYLYTLSVACILTFTLYSKPYLRFYL